MGVIVIGMEMPICCGECEASGTGVCRKWSMEYAKVFPPDCPLRSLDSVVEQIRGLYKDSQNGAAGEYVRGWDNAIDACLAVITRSAELSEEEERIEEAREENRRAMGEMGPANDYEIYGDPYFGHKGYYDE